MKIDPIKRTIALLSTMIHRIEPHNDKSEKAVRIAYKRLEEIEKKYISLEDFKQIQEITGCDTIKDFEEKEAWYKSVAQSNAQCAIDAQTSISLEDHKKGLEDAFEAGYKRAGFVYGIPGSQEPEPPAFPWWQMEHLERMAN